MIDAVRMVLSGVARTESRFACGKILIAQMLCGSNSAKIKKLRLNQLSTFGLLWQLKQAEVVTLIDILIAIGCLEQEDIDRFRPVLKITPLGGDVMRGKADLPAGLKLPDELWFKLRRTTAKGERQISVGGGQRSDSRDQRSDGGGQRPDEADVAADYDGPPTYDEWVVESIDDGEMGEDFEQGEPIFGEIATQPTTPPSRPETKTDRRSPPQSRPASGVNPPYYWTWLLLSRGFSAAECMAIRGITRETLLDHVLQAAENGLKIDIASCMEGETIAALEKVVGDNRPKQIRPLLEQLPPGTRYEEVQIYLRCRSG